MSIAPFPMVRLENRYGRYCWHNACIFATIHLWKTCKIPMPKEGARHSSGSSYFGIFQSWLTLERSVERSPVLALQHFTREFLPANSPQVGNATQDASLFFQALSGDLRHPNIPLAEFDWMQPISQERWWTNRCLKCFEFPGDTPPPLPPQRNSMFRLELPLEPREGENLQSLINEHFRVKDEQRKQMVQCPHEGCTSRVARFSVSELLDPKAAIVFFVNRQQNNPVWAEAFFRDLSAEEQANYPAQINYRPVQLSNVIKVPMNGGGVAMYQLVAAVEHSGESAAGGHFVGFLRAEDGEWYVANDALPLRHLSHYPEYCPTKGILFLYQNITNDGDMA